MIRNTVIIICFFCLCLIPRMHVIAQDELIPMLEQIKLLKGNEKIDLLNKISAEYRKSDRYASINYARQAFDLSVAGNYMAGEALALKNEGICWFFIGNNDSAMYCYSQALGFYKKINDKKGISACYNNLGLVSQETGKYDEAMKLYRLSIEMDRKLGDSIGVAGSMENIADILMYRGEIKKALAITNETLRIYIGQSYKPGILMSYSNRGAEYDYLGNYSESVNNYLKVLDLARELNDKYQEIMALSNMGIAYWHWNKPDIAMQYLTKALEMSDENEEGYNIYTTQKTLADIYTSQQMYVKSNEILQNILNRNEENENKRYVAVIMTSIGRNLIELNEIDKAIGYLNKSLNIAMELDAKYEILDNYRALIYAQSMLHNHREVDSFQNLYTDLHIFLKTADSIGDPMNHEIVSDVRVESSPLITDWIIAFLVLIFVLVFSVVAFKEK